MSVIIDEDKKGLVKYKAPEPCAAFEYVDNGQTANINISVVESVIADICEKMQIEDLRKEKQRPFKAVMFEVGATLFPGKRMLKDNKLYYRCTANNNNDLYANSGLYNYNILNKLADMYITICNKYNKVIDINGFSLFANIEDRVIYNWRDEGKANPQGNAIYKKIHQIGEYSLQDAIVDTGQAVGLIAVGNTRYNWSAKEQAEVTKAKALSLDSLPQLEIVKVVDITQEKP